MPLPGTQPTATLSGLMNKAEISRLIKAFLDAVQTGTPLDTSDRPTLLFIYTHSAHHDLEGQAYAYLVAVHDISLNGGNILFMTVTLYNDRCAEDLRTGQLRVTLLPDRMVDYAAEFIES